MKVSFKKQPKARGLSGVGYPYPQVDIKIDKKIMGIIYPPTWQTLDKKWTVAFRVLKEETEGNPNCVWKTIVVNRKFDTEDECRKFVVENIEAFSKKYVFYFVE